VTLVTKKNEIKRRLFLSMADAAAATPFCWGKRMQETGFLKRTITISNGSYLHVVYVPSGWTNGRQ